jgi:hypothetical protein
MKKTKNSLFLIGLVIAITGVFIFPIQAFSQGTSTIPAWIKENSKWWSEGKIGDQDYISGLQYLVSHGILKIPVVVGANDPQSVNNNAQSFIVHVFSDKEYVFDTFSKFSNTGQTVPSSKPDPNLPSTISTTSAAEFQLESLTSADKKDFYNLISSYLTETSSTIRPYNINIDVVAGDGSIIETLQYGGCRPTGYSVYTNDDSSLYRLSNKDGLEIREDTNFMCAGFHIVVP